MKTNAVRLHSQGDANVMSIESVELDAPGPGEVLLEQNAIGLNYMDVYQRSGLYPLELPSGLGLEAAGKVIEVGPDVNDLKTGDRVVYGPVLGAYAQHRIAPAARMIKIPDGISDDIAAAVLMKGMTVEYLMCRTYPVKAGENVLFHAASGGVGHIAGQWGKQIGARMIGVTSGEQNCKAILEHGYDAAIDRNADNIADRVRELTNGDEAPAVSPSTLQHNGSLYFCRPTLANYVATREDLVHSANAVFDMVNNGAVRVSIGQKRPLAEIVDVHNAFESGDTTGSTLLIP